MIRYLAIFLLTGLVTLVLWLPHGYAARDFYRSLRTNHNDCSHLFGSTFADRALAFALSAAEKEPSAVNVGHIRAPSSVESKAAVRLREVVSRVAAQRYFFNVNAMAALALYRVAIMLYVARGIGVALVAALADAAIRRTVRQQELRQHDPERFALALTGAMTLLIALGALLVFPANISPTLLPLMLFAVTYCLHVAVANYRPGAS